MFVLASLGCVTDGKIFIIFSLKSEPEVQAKTRSTPFEQRDAYCTNTLKPQLKQLNAYMAGSKFVAGDTLTYVDFMFWEILDHMTLFGKFYRLK